MGGGSQAPQGSDNYNRMVSNGSTGSNQPQPKLRMSVGGRTENGANHFRQQLKTLDNIDDNDEYGNEDEMFEKAANGANNRRPESARVKLPLRDSLMHQQQL